MTTAVKELFQKIESLSDKDRLALDKLLARKLEAEWQEGAKKARVLAKKRKVTFADINTYIERRRLRGMKVFFDTNVYVAETLLGEGALDIMRAMTRGRCRIFVNMHVINETAHVLTDYMGLSNRFVRLTQQRILQRSTLVEGHSKAKVPEDSKDTPILRAALACGAHFLVTNDRHLLLLDPFESLRIISMDGLIQVLKERSLL